MRSELLRGARVLRDGLYLPKADGNLSCSTSCVIPSRTVEAFGQKRQSLGIQRNITKAAQRLLDGSFVAFIAQTVDLTSHYENSTAQDVVSWQLRLDFSLYVCLYGLIQYGGLA